MLAGRDTFIINGVGFKSNMDSGMFLPEQLAAAKAVSLGTEWYAQLNNTYAARREKAFHLLDLIQCTYDRQQSGMFVWAKTPASGADGYALSDSVLQAARVFITPGGIFVSQGLPSIRISLCAPAAVFARALQPLQTRLRTAK